MPLEFSREKLFGINEFNPKKLSIEKIGKCEHDDHEYYVGKKTRNEKLRLIMFYSANYNTILETMDINKLSNEELYEFYEKIEEFKWKPNSEQYWCEYCIECLTKD